MNNIASFINEYYTVKDISSKVDARFSNVDDFFLGETHTSEGCHQINSLFINTFANPKKDLVLIEGIPSMQKAEKKQVDQMVRLTTNIPTYGWDKIILDPVNLPLIEKIQKIQSTTINLLQQKKMSICPFEQQEIQLKMTELNKRLIQIDQEQKQFNWEHICNGFSPRTQSMLKSLEAAKKIATHIFTVAGSGHFVLKSDPRLSLHIFYEYLHECERNDSRQYVVLVPKESKVKQIDEDFMQKAKLVISMIVDFIRDNPYWYINDEYLCPFSKPQ